MKIAIDTDVLVAAIRSPNGASRRIFELIDKKTVIPAISVPLMFEYEAVLKRESHLRATGLKAEDIDRFLDALAKRASLVRIDVLWRPSLGDENDEMVLETALNGGCETIVTFNLKDYVGAKFSGVCIATPSQFLKENGYARI